MKRALALLPYNLPDCTEFLHLLTLVSAILSAGDRLKSHPAVFRPVPSFASFFLFGYGISSSFRQVVWVQLARDPLWKCVCVFLFFLPSFARLRQSRSRDSACRRSFRWRTQEKGHVMGCRRSFRHRTSRLSFVQPIGFVFGRNGSDCRLQLGSRCARDGVSGLAHRQLLSLFVVALIRSCAKAQRHLKSVYSRGAC